MATEEETVQAVRVIGVGDAKGIKLKDKVTFCGVFTGLEVATSQKGNQFQIPRLVGMFLTETNVKARGGDIPLPSKATSSPAASAKPKPKGTTMTLDDL